MTYRRGNTICDGYRPFVGNTCKTCGNTVGSRERRAEHDKFCENFQPCQTQEEWDARDRKSRPFLYDAEPRPCFRCKSTKLPLNSDSLCEACGEPEGVVGSASGLEVPSDAVPLVGVYPWCSRPELCAGKGYCPRDPNCGD